MCAIPTVAPRVACLSFVFSADVVKTRVQAAQAETVGKQFTAGRSSIYGPPPEPCDKCRQQCRLYTTSARASATSAANAALDVHPNGPRIMNPARPPTPLPSGTIAALLHIAHREGPRGLYRGLDVALLMAVPATVLYYAVYDDMLARLEGAGAGKVMAPITSGASARILATVCMAPLELVRTRVQSERASTAADATTRPAWVGRRGLGGLPMAPVGRAVVAVVREEGALALWRGVGTTMWRDVPFSMIYWLGYENLKDRLGCKWRPAEDTSGLARGQSSIPSRARGEPGNQRGSADFLLRSFAAGALSGVVASLLTHPFDVVKTQQQILIKDSQGEKAAWQGSWKECEGCWFPRPQVFPYC